MRKLLLPFVLLLCAAPSWATIALAHSASSAACPTSGTTCTLAISSTATGHLIVVWAFMATLGTTNSLSSVNCGGALTIDSGSLFPDPTVGGSQEMAFRLLSTSGTTSCVFNFTNAVNSVTTVAEAEYSYTATSVALDTSGGRDQASTTNPAGVALTLSGANDVIVQAISPVGTASAISGTYSNPALFPGGWGFAGSINTASGTAPTWTCSAGNSILSAEAFKEVTSSGPPPNQMPMAR